MCYYVNYRTFKFALDGRDRGILFQRATEHHIAWSLTKHLRVVIVDQSMKK